VSLAATCKALGAAAAAFQSARAVCLWRFVALDARRNKCHRVWGVKSLLCESENGGCDGVCLCSVNKVGHVYLHLCVSPVGCEERDDGASKKLPDALLMDILKNITALILLKNIQNIERCFCLVSYGNVYFTQPKRAGQHV
jgi:hypothetical protein